MGVQWTTERVDRLKGLYADGLTGTQIAGQFGDITRNAVIGKIHRLGLAINTNPIQVDRLRSAQRAKSDRDRSSKMKIAQVVRIKANGAEVRVPVDNTLERMKAEPAPPEFLAIPFEALTSTTCRWPRGEGPFTFCGQNVLEGHSYCRGCYRKSTSQTPVLEVVA